MDLIVTFSGNGKYSISVKKKKKEEIIEFKKKQARCLYTLVTSNEPLDIISTCKISQFDFLGTSNYLGFHRLLLHRSDGRTWFGRRAGQEA